MCIRDREYLEYDELMERIDFYRPWLAKTYVNAMNIIHYMHDKYSYEKSQMALHDSTCLLYTSGCSAWPRKTP